MIATVIVAVEEWESEGDYGLSLGNESKRY